MYYTHKNIMRKAIIAFCMMFGILFAAATAIVWYLKLPLGAGLSVAVITVALQYLLGPLLINLIYGIDFDKETINSSVNPELLVFISRVCSENNIPSPKIGIIDDGNPNAFTYGHLKWDARLIVTKGLLDILDEQEQQAVVAHELGHIRNNDFILMTLVSLIPMLLYQVYAWTKKSDKANAAYWIGVGAYAVYVFSQYFVLAFSRIREYLADNFSKRIMGTGEPLKTALIKIAYGFTKNSESKKLKLRASTFGIANAAQSEAFLLLNYRNDEEDNKSYRKMMNWDVSNVWGKWYELNSTHPLTAKRILALSDESIDLKKPGIRGYFSFLLEAAIKLLPWITTALIVVTNIKIVSYRNITGNLLELLWKQPLYPVLLGISVLITFYYSYGRDFRTSKIEEMLLREDASPVKGIPAELEGKIIGKGIPGLLWSKDIMLDDGTGIILVNYKQPFRFLELFFGIFEVDDLLETEARITGWYRRGNRPYFVCKEIIANGRIHISFNYILTKILAYALLAGGMVLYALRLIGII